MEKTSGKRTWQRFLWSGSFCTSRECWLCLWTSEKDGGQQSFRSNPARLFMEVHPHSQTPKHTREGRSWSEVPARKVKPAGNHRLSPGEERGNSLDVHFEAGGDVGGVLLVPAAVEALGVGVGPTGHRGLPRRSCRQKSRETSVRAEVDWSSRISLVLQDHHTLATLAN